MTALKIVDILLDDEVQLPHLSEIVSILRRHPLFKLRIPVREGYLIGSFAGGRGQPHSDVDVLLIVDPQPDMTAQDVESHYRRLLMRHFMQNNLTGKHDHLHPQWHGRRVDVYFAYDVSDDQRTRPLIKLPP